MRNIVIVILCLFSSVLFAQNEYGEFEFNSLEKKKIGASSDKLVTFKLSFLMPAVGAEFRLAKKFSLDISGKLNGAIATNNTMTQFKLFPFPVVHVEPKWNYNIEKREKKGKKIENFNSNFVSLFISYRVKVSYLTRNVLILGPTWGMQRSLGNIGYFKFNAGLGYWHYFDNLNVRGNVLPVLPILDVQLGIMF